MKVDRERAKAMLARRRLVSLDDATKLEYLGEYWDGRDEETIREAMRDGDFPRVSDELVATIAATDAPRHPLPHGVDALLLDWLVFDLDKASNGYLQDELGRLGVACEVVGPPDPAAPCPCCHHLSIDPGESGLWDICPVCFWENGGDGPNHMSLAEARSNFARIGAVSERALAFVDPDGPFKYERSASDRDVPIRR